ncbi:single-stranded DNA-binding protein [Brevibacterium album]|uniref:single-stranded DNA-binding protein n=1 Tax=Brevibacterium album TaxID=417948 RepID=UPI0003F8424F|nr:single-stranded DNA-binding protein [Brevibacterium album]
MRITTTIVGGLAANARTGSLPDGRSVANFRVGVDHRRRDPQTGEYTTTGTSWFDVSAYGVLATNAAFSLKKGDQVIVVGELRLRDWDNGEKTGTSGDITAHAVGPSLQFGVAPLTKNRELTGPGEQHGTAGGAEAEGGAEAASGHWSAPGASAHAADAQTGADTRPADGAVAEPSGESAELVEQPVTAGVGAGADGPPF